MKKTSVKS